MNNHLSPLNTTLHPAIWQNYWRLLLLSFLFVFFMVFKGFGQLSVELVSINPQCGGFATGVITAIPSGGTAPYSYLWSTNSTSNPITNLQPGIYSVTVTDVLGDTATATDTLTAPPPLSVHINVDTCTLPGAMTVNVSGGVTPYSYTWNTGDTTASIGNLSMGEYCVTVLDNNNCGFVTCQTIGSPLNAFVSTTDVVCEISQGGTATAGHTGGVFPFSYSWNSGQSTETIENLPPGIYTTTVTSYNGCTATASDTVGLVPGNFDVALTPTQPTCWGSYTGSIEATVPVSSDTAFFYKWSNSEYGPIIDSLQAGTYVVTVSDSYGCTGIDSSTLSYLSHLSLTLLANDPTCHDSGDGSITANPSGGVLPYNFAWSNGDTTATIQNLGAGTYAVVVTDSLLCSATMADTLTAPPLFYIDMTSLDASQCGAQDGSATATPGGGGSPPFTYEWNNGGADSTLTQLAAGNYTAKVTSAEGCIATDSVEINQPDTLGVSISGTTLICGADSSGTLTANVLFGTGPFSYNWSNGDTTETIADLPAGSYDVTVTSSEGCTGLQNYAIEGSPDILISLTPNYIDCFGNDNGQIVANSSGGTPPLSFLWSNGATGSTISNLVAGSYTLSVTDAWGCSQASQALITSPDSLVLSLNPVPGDCGQNGSIDLEITGGTLPYNILWNNGDTTTAVQNAPAGLYNVTVTDGNGCQAFGTTTLPGQSVLQLIFATNNATCNGTSDGEIQAWATAGVPPYDYQWNNGDSGSLISNLSTGLYEVTLTDATGCSLVSAVEIMALHALNLAIDAPDYLCQDSTTTAIAIVSNATGPVSFEWSNGETTGTISDLTTGTYAVTVTDALGCFGSSTATIGPAGDFTINEIVENVSCFGEANGSISLDVSGGVAPLSFNWNTGGTTPVITDLTPGTYDYQIADSAGCVATGSTVITEPPALTLEINPVNGSCGNTGSVTATAGGGSPGYSFLWSNGQSTPAIDNLGSGTYSLTLTDGNGCQIMDAASVQVFDMPECNIVLNHMVTTIGGDDGEIEVQMAGGIGPFTLNWNNGDTTVTATNLPAGTYELVATDVDNCQTSCSFTLYNPGRIGDFAWFDENENGMQDAGETGIGDLTVTLEGIDAYDNSFMQTTITDTFGIYNFVVQPGSYKLSFEILPDLVASPLNQGPEELDSDIDPATGQTALFTLGDGASVMSWDAGFTPASPCDNATSGGTICCDQLLCAPGELPQSIDGVLPPAGGSGALEYTWMFSNTPGPFNPFTWTAIPASNQPEWYPGMLTETTYFVRLATRENCQDYLPSNVVTIEVKLLLQAVIEGPQVVCIDNPAVFSTMNEGSGATYHWEFGDDASPVEAVTSVVDNVQWDTPGEKTVVLTTEKNGCQTSDTLLVEVSDSPAVCSDELIISAQKTGPFAVRINWDYPPSDSVQQLFEVEWASETTDFTVLGGPDSISPDGTLMGYVVYHSSPVMGRNYYRVHLQDTTGGELYSNVAEVVITGEFNLVHVFPNPFGNKIQAEFFDRHDAHITLELITPDGRILRTFDVPDEGFAHSFEVEELARGLFFLRIKYDGTVQKIYKLVKM